MAQVDASDKREVTFPNGTTLATTCLLPGKFDILAVNLFEFVQEWPDSSATRIAALEIPEVHGIPTTKSARDDRESDMAA